MPRFLLCSDGVAALVGFVREIPVTGGNPGMGKTPVTGGNPDMGKTTESLHPEINELLRGPVS